MTQKFSFVILSHCTLLEFFLPNTNISAQSVLFVNNKIKNKNLFFLFLTQMGSEYWALSKQGSEYWVLNLSKNLLLKHWPNINTCHRLLMHTFFVGSEYWASTNPLTKSGLRFSSLRNGRGSEHWTLPSGIPMVQQNKPNVKICTRIFKSMHSCHQFLTHNTWVTETLLKLIFNYVCYHTSN